MERLLDALRLLLIPLWLSISPTPAADTWTANLYPLEESGINGIATLTQAGETIQVSLSAVGLRPGAQYVSGVHTRESDTCEGGLVRADTASGLSKSFSKTEPGVTYPVTGRLNDIWAISLQETTDGSTPVTRRACAERWPGSLSVALEQIGSSATITLRLSNLTGETLTLVDLRSQIPPGMGLAGSWPPAQITDNEVRWIHVSGITPGQTRSFSYRLSANGLNGTVRAWASLIGEKANTTTVSQARTISTGTVRAAGEP